MCVHACVWGLCVWLCVYIRWLSVCTVVGVVVWLYVWICCVCEGCLTVLVVVCVVSYVFHGQVYVAMLCAWERGCMIVSVVMCVWFYECRQCVVYVVMWLCVCLCGWVCVCVCVCSAYVAVWCQLTCLSSSLVCSLREDASGSYKAMTGITESLTFRLRWLCFSWRAFHWVFAWEENWARSLVSRTALQRAVTLSLISALALLPDPEQKHIPGPRKQRVNL